MWTLLWCYDNCCSSDCFFYVVRITRPKCLCQDLLPYGRRETDDTLTVSTAITMNSCNGRNVLLLWVIYFKWTAINVASVSLLSSVIPPFLWTVMRLSGCWWELSSSYCYPALARLSSHCAAFSRTFGTIFFFSFRDLVCLLFNAAL